MIILEHEAEALLKADGLSVPDGTVIHTAQEAAETARQIGGAVVLKAQIPAGGRMKAGGVRFADSPDAAEKEAGEILGAEMRGHRVEALLVEKKLAIDSEIFIAITYDDALRRPLVIASTEGGIEVETAEAVTREPFSLLSPFSDYQGREIAANLGFSGKPVVQLGNIIKRLVQNFARWDALLLECNPVIRDTDGRWWIADVHLDLDDDAIFRQAALVGAVPASTEVADRRSDFEQQAMNIDRADHRGVAGRLIPFDGELGLLIGGGGASLTAMDAVLDAGLNPANYCEIGGNPSVWKIKELTKLILSQPGVDQLVVIMNVVSNTRVDLVARGVIKGVLENGGEPDKVIRAFRVPGSWEDEGRALLDHYNIRYFGRETSIDQVVEAIKS